MLFTFHFARYDVLLGVILETSAEISERAHYGAIDIFGPDALPNEATLGGVPTPEATGMFVLANIPCQNTLTAPS